MSRHYQEYRESVILLYSILVVLFVLGLLVIAIAVFAEEQGGHWSGLKILDYVLLEDFSGNRYARIIYTNPTDRDKIFVARYFIATLMDYNSTKVEGASSGPSYFVRPKEIRTETVYFGRHRFPISHIETK